MNIEMWALPIFKKAGFTPESIHSIAHSVMQMHAVRSASFSSACNLRKQSHLLMMRTFVRSAADPSTGCALRILPAILRDRGNKLIETKNGLAPLVLT